MRASFIKAAGEAEVREEPTPRPTGDEVLVRVDAVGLCGSDIQRAQCADRWERWGHEFSGVVESVGSEARRFGPGDEVVWVPVTPCGRCRRCLAGNPLMCLAQRSRPCVGAAELACDPEDFWLPRDGLTPAQGAVAEPLTVAIDLVEEGGVSLGDVVVLFGAGPIGLMAGRLSQLRGAGCVVMVELSRAVAKIELARAWGLEVIEADAEDVPAAVRGVAPDGADVVLVTAPPAVLPTAIGCCAFGATVALIGTAYGGAEQVTLDVNEFHFRNVRIQGANNCPVLRFPMAFDLLAQGAVDVEALISHELPLAETQDALDLARDHPDEVIKIVVRP